MGWPNESARQTAPRSGLIGTFLHWLGGLAVEDRLTSDLDERELRRIRAKQIDAIMRQIPVTMAVTMLNVAVVLILFGGTGWNGFLALWALTLAATCSGSRSGPTAARTNCRSSETWIVCPSARRTR